MNDLPQEQLNQLLTTYGNQLCEEPQRCEALLRDTFPSYPREVSLLVNALKQGVPQELLSSHNKIPFEVTRSRLSHKLAENLFVQEQAAQWVVDAWSEALGVKQVPNRPMTTMQSPDLGGPSGGPQNPGQSSGQAGGQWVNAAPSDAAYNPTMVSPSGNIGTPNTPSASGSGVPGSAPTVVNPGSNSGNYANPANYNAPSPNVPNYGNPNYGTPNPPENSPVNYGGSYAMVQPHVGPPSVWTWFIVYCVLMVLYCAFLMFMAFAHAKSNPTTMVVQLLLNGMGVILFIAALFLPKQRWAWIYDIVMICFGFITCCLPFSIALLVFWLRPEVKRFFNAEAN
jgi:hypothetical protein